MNLRGEAGGCRCHWQSTTLPFRRVRHRFTLVFTWRLMMKRYINRSGENPAIMPLNDVVKWHRGGQKSPPISLVRSYLFVRVIRIAADAQAYNVVRVGVFALSLAMVFSASGVASAQSTVATGLVPVDGPELLPVLRQARDTGRTNAA